jgi:uncharacterized membrane protein HdeD (DUF308 family)
LLAAFLVVDGVISFIASMQGRRMQSSWGRLLLEGVAGITLGLLAFMWPGVTVLAIVLILGLWAMLTSPGAGAVAIAWMIGAYAILFGVSLIFLRLRLRKHNIIIDI